jgi:hypothetical protein
VAVTIFEVEFLGGFGPDVVPVLQESGDGVAKMDWSLVLLSSDGERDEVLAVVVARGVGVPKVPLLGTGLLFLSSLILLLLFLICCGGTACFGFLDI